MLVELGLAHSQCRLLSCSAENKLSPGLVDAIGKILERLQTGGIDGSHVAKPENNDRRQVRQAIHNDIDFVSCTKQEWPMDPENADVSGNFFMLEDVDVLLPNVLRCHF